MLILFLILIVLALVILIANIAIVPQAYSYVVERLGVYYTTWEAGFHFKTPFVTRIAKKVSLKEQVVDFKPQPVITRDNVTMQIDTVVFFQITDPKLFTYGVERPLSAIENLSATTLRNIIGLFFQTFRIRHQSVEWWRLRTHGQLSHFSGKR